MTHIKRNLHFVLPAVRSYITTRIVFYWCACVVFSTMPLIIGTTLARSDRLFVDHLGELFQRFWPLYLMIFGILPFAVRDALRVANRTLGPLHRLRREMARYRETGQFTPIECRQDDFLSELVQDVNLTMTSRAAVDDPLELSEMTS